MVVIHPEQLVNRCCMNPWDESLVAVSGPHDAKTYRLDYTGSGSNRQVLAVEAGVSFDKVSYVEVSEQHKDLTAGCHLTF